MLGPALDGWQEATYRTYGSPMICQCGRGESLMAVRPDEIGMADASSTRIPGSDFLSNALVEAGIEHLIGLPGTQTLPLDQTVADRDDIEYVMARHETAIPHMAWGYYEANRQMAATITVPGPGDTNAAHGLKNALNDNVPIIHISPIPAPDDFGKHPIHELPNETFDHVVKRNLNVDSSSRLREVIARGIESAQTPPCGPVRLGIPSPFLEGSVAAPVVDVDIERTTYNTDDTIAEAGASLAAADRPLVYVGGGARRSPDGPSIVAELAELLDAPVAASFKGKGVFPETADRFLGVTGDDMPSGALTAFESADVVLALGTNFDGPNTRDWSLSMGTSLIHVDIVPGETGAAYKPDIAVVGDVGRAGSALVAALHERSFDAGWEGAALATAVREEYVAQLRKQELLAEGPPASTPGVLRTVRDVVPDDAVVTTDIGGHRIWSKNAFPANKREKFVTPGSWAGMGVGLPSAIGAKLAVPDRPVVTLTGDGSLFMCAQELHTAAEYDLDLTAVLFNDADYGIISKSMETNTDRRFSWSSPDWEAIAVGYGCEARSAATRTEVEEAVEWALETDGPTLVDVEIDPKEVSPYEIVSLPSGIDPSSF